MSKPLADSVGQMEHVLLALTFLGVLYLVLKTANINVSVSKEGYAGSSLGFHSATDGSTGPDYSPGMKLREGMVPHEPPAWHSTAYDSSLLDQHKELADEDLGAGAEGMRGGYAKVASRSGMLAKALNGGNASF
jgi:hypothetical protein